MRALYSTHQCGKVAQFYTTPVKPSRGHGGIYLMAAWVRALSALVYRASSEGQSNCRSAPRTVRTTGLQPVLVAAWAWRLGGKPGMPAAVPASRYGTARGRLRDGSRRTVMN